MKEFSESNFDEIQKLISKLLEKIKNSCKLERKLCIDTLISQIRIFVVNFDPELILIKSIINKKDFSNVLNSN